MSVQTFKHSLMIEDSKLWKHSHTLVNRIKILMEFSCSNHVSFTTTVLSKHIRSKSKFEWFKYDWNKLKFKTLS